MATRVEGKPKTTITVRRGLKLAVSFMEHMRSHEGAVEFEGDEAADFEAAKEWLNDLERYFRWSESERHRRESGTARR